MGLLDDAIREHLELKRLRGADPGDVARLEREALGPVRRGAVGPEEPPPDEALAPRSEPFDAERAGDRPLVDESLTLIPDEEQTTVGQDTAEIDMQTVIGLDPDEPVAEPEPAAPVSQHYETQVPDRPPAPAERPPEGEDVLEETPSFLQQTPEHDRLWFEQQPPRDFDFDK